MFATLSSSRLQPCVDSTVCREVPTVLLQLKRTPVAITAYAWSIFSIFAYCFLSLPPKQK
jgi:hypothetical protein